MRWVGWERGDGEGVGRVEPGVLVVHSYGIGRGQVRRRGSGGTMDRMRPRAAREGTGREGAVRIGTERLGAARSGKE